MTNSFGLISHYKSVNIKTNYYLFPSTNRPDLSAGVRQDYFWKSAEAILNDAQIPYKDCLKNFELMKKHTMALEFLANVLTDKLKENYPDLPLAEELVLKKPEDLLKILKEADENGIPLNIQLSLSRDFRGENIE